jgi:hypothetical protein
MWGWLFWKRDMTRVIKICFADSELQTGCLSITLVDSSGIRRALPKSDGERATPVTALSSTETPAKELHLKYEKGDGGPALSKAFISPDGLRLERASFPPWPLGVYLAARSNPTQENAQRFSKLEEIGRIDDVVEGLTILEPRLTRLALLLTGSGPVIHGDIGLGRLIPLTYMGEGLSRLATTILAIANAPGGTVLVDEIENGFHYSVVRQVWRAIAAAARQHDVQLFATTHSWECIRAAQEAFAEDHPEDLQLYRLDRIDGQVRAAVFTPDMIESALSHGLEMR